MSGRTLVLRDANVGGDQVDVLIRDGLIAAVGAAGADGAAGAAGAADDEIRLEGRHLMPGLWDNHVHMNQWALFSKRPSTFHAGSAREAAAIMATALVENGGLPTNAEGAQLPLVGTGFRDGLWPDTPNLELLDAASSTAPIMLVSADLHTVWLNTPALGLFGLAGHPTGVLREEPAFEIEGRINSLPDDVLDQWVEDASLAAAARGVVGIVDLEMSWNTDSWLRRSARAPLAHRVEAGVYPQHLERAIEAGMRTGDALGELITVGRLKIITDGSLGTRTAYCFDEYPGLEGQPNSRGLLTLPPDELEALLRRGISAGLVPTVHAIGDHANSHVLDVFEKLGISGRIEHAQLLTSADTARLGALRAEASVQPEHALDDRDLADRHWHGRTADAFRVRSLVEAGATLALGSDAPVAPLDPWVTIAAATERTKDERAPWHPEETIGVDDAIAASIRSSIAIGQPADLVALDADPATADSQTLRTMPVALTLLAGRTTHTTL
ncbi:amidohydrolase [Agrococcus casei]|uniref:amidohydrolase n=1 Tax=Agrococcus casei TaxID=343512 RepID=UPI003F925A00